MSISGTILVVIAASFLKPLLSTNQSFQLPTVTVYDRYNNVSPFEEADPESDGVPNLFLTVRLPQLLANAKNSDIDRKRQFDPWGGKRHLKSFTKDEEADRKRQFSPWGGKRSPVRISQSTGDNDSTDVDLHVKDLLSPENKRGFNSWGGKRYFNVKDSKRGFNSWGGKKSFNSWGGKRNFNAWGGKRFLSDLDESSDVESSILKKNQNSGGKRQAFNSWGGKRGFNSWGGKRDLNSWGGKRSIDLEPEIKELSISEGDVVPSTYNVLTEGTGRNVH